MTAENGHDHEVAPSFTWKDSYRTQLETLAETDELTDDLDWPQLKDAVKYLLTETFASWPGTSQIILHPATILIPKDDSQSMSSNSGSSQSSYSAGPMGLRQVATNGGISAQNGGGNGAYNYAPSAPKPRDTSPGEVSVSQADLQAFFPSKKQASASLEHSWGRRYDTIDQREQERRLIFSMLDDFEGQPPFTIQRLSELVLRPTQHHHTLPKYASALRRLLSVTATRDAFPNRSEEMDSAGGTELDMEGTNGYISGVSAGERSRSGTPVPGSPSTAPLFSPIPFLLRSGDEGMPRRMGEQDRDGALVVEEDVPGMELGGADRTTEEGVESARRSGAGAGSGKAVVDSISRAGTPTEHHSPGGTHIAGAMTSIAPSEEALPVPSSPGASTAGAGRNDVGASTPAEGTQPLGVPTGRVDELDEVGIKQGSLPGGAARALSSTTTATMSSEEETGEHNNQDDGEGSEPTRALKRIKSERDLGSKN